MPSSLVIHLTACLLLHLSHYLGNHLGNLEILRAEGFCLIGHSQTESKAAETVMLLSVCTTAGFNPVWSLLARRRDT